MIWLLLIFLGLGIVYFYQGKKVIRKAMAVQDEEERIAMMKLGKRTLRYGQAILLILLALLLAAIAFVLYVEFVG